MSNEISDDQEVIKKLYEAWRTEVKPTVIAKQLDLTAGVVTQQYKRFDKDPLAEEDRRAVYNNWLNRIPLIQAASELRLPIKKVDKCYTELDNRPPTEEDLVQIKTLWLDGTLLTEIAAQLRLKLSWVKQEVDRYKTTTPLTPQQIVALKKLWAESSHTAAPAVSLGLDLNAARVCYNTPLSDDQRKSLYQAWLDGTPIKDIREKFGFSLTRALKELHPVLDQQLTEGQKAAVTLRFDAGEKPSDIADDLCLKKRPVSDFLKATFPAPPSSTVYTDEDVAYIRAWAGAKDDNVIATERGLNPRLVTRIRLDICGINLTGSRGVGYRWSSNNSDDDYRNRNAPGGSWNPNNR